MKRLLAATVVAILATYFVPVARAATIIYHEDFTSHSASALALTGTAPDVDNNGGTNSWLAYSGYKQNGVMPTTTAQGAWLPFAPQPGNTYTLSASMTGITATGTTSVAWYALGFAKALPTAANAENGSQNRFIEAPTLGRAWMFYRATNTATNMIQLGNNSTGTGAGPQSPAAWSDSSLSGAGDIDMKIVLDTNPAIWTATFFAKRPTDSLYTQVSNGALNLLTQDITGIGFTRTTNTSGTVMSGTITRFTLESVAPAYIAGDVNGDGHVDILDFNIIRDHLFQSGTHTQGDLTNDGFVDFSDFRAWKSAPPSGAGASVNVAIPEPASALLAMIATAGSFFVGRRRRGVASQQSL